MQLVVDNTVLGPLTLNTERVRGPDTVGGSVLSPLAHNQVLWTF